MIAAKTVSVATIIEPSFTSRRDSRLSQRSLEALLEARAALVHSRGKTLIQHMIEATVHVGAE